MLLGQHCSMLSTILFGTVTPDCGLIQAQQYCLILLTTRNNVAPTILLHPVFNNLLQLVILPCNEERKTLEPVKHTSIILKCHHAFSLDYILVYNPNLA